MRSILNWFRRSRVRLPEPFPDEWAAFLWDHSAHYRRLPGRLQTAFERDVQRLIAKQRITGVETKVDDRLRLLVAASAATLSVGWPGYKWSELSEVLLYPDDFDRDYTVGRLNSQESLTSGALSSCRFPRSVAASPITRIPIMLACTSSRTC
jgi:Mlc titration factor MtfA (ptsG expression regulator)